MPTLVRDMVTELADLFRQALYTGRQLLRQYVGPRYQSSDICQDDTFDCCISYNRFGGYCVPQASIHQPAAQEILSGNVYEEETISYLTSTADGCDIIHAGAYFGDFLPALSRSRSEGAYIWAFEPNPISYRAASITKLINYLENVHLFEAGLGSQSCVKSLRITDVDGRPLGGESSLVGGSNNDGPSKHVDVNVVRLDEVIPDRSKVAAIHLDVEGYEQDALAGANNIIKESRPILVLEALPQRKWVEQNLHPLGYKVNGKVHRNFVLRANSHT